jgi:Secretion system C-terminal sorting domain/PKD domain
MQLKLRFPTLLLLLLSWLPGQILYGQCTVTVTPQSDTLCIGDSTTLTAVVPAGGSILTTMAAGNNHRGNMFDLTAINTVTITQFAGSPMATTGIAIYYRVGTFVGFENNSAGWTLVGTAANVVPIGSPTPTPFPIPVNVTIPAGQTYGFYVTSTNTAVSLNYTNGTTLGNVFASDANLQFKEGKGMEYPFCNGGSPFSPRNWNGRIYYTVPSVASYAWSNGSTASSITVMPTTTTSYSVVATAGGTCADTATVYVGNASVDLGLDTSFCAGNLVTLDAGAGLASYAWSTGATTQTIPYGGTGTVSVGVTDGLGCTDADTISLTLNPNPAVALGADTVICGAGPLVLDAGNPGGSYAWNNGPTTQTQSLTMGGVYQVLVTDVNGCQGSDTISIGLSDPSINIGNDTTLCNAASTTLTVGGGWLSVLWSNGSTNDFITVNASNSYAVSVVDSLGCGDSDTIMVTAAAAPIASFGVTGDATCTVATVTNSSIQGTTFLWNWGDGNTSTGANPGPHNYSQAFTGNITLTVTNACGTDDLIVPFGCVGIAGAQLLDIQLFPNPSDGRMQLTVNGLDANDIDLTVLNLQGQRVHAGRYAVTGSSFTQPLDLSHLAKGVYLVRILAENGQYTRRIQIQ